ncbi:MAG: PQQ-like beta-propeller repeat protein, partial [Candidatus Omnitrophica bacterium]|nr:PQQ-like beta-propeller repeat protein [Candidatus Omnitrophota bacterium]
DEGKEVWRYSYSSKVKRNHGMSRTVPAVSGDYLVTLGPKCDVHCFHPMTGELYWEKDLVKEYGTRVPEWYAGQCPLIEKDRVILAPGGKCLLTAIDLATGDTIWETPNDQNWDMTHVSIVPYEFEGEKHYAWCATGGALGVNAETGKLLWTHPDWQIKIANIPSPVDVGGGKIFLSGGYNAGSEMLQILKTDSGYTADSVFKTEPTVFGSDQQTPILLNGFLYGVIPGGKLACLDLSGNQQWVDEENLFGLGPYMAINGKLLVLDDNEKKPGELTLFDVSPQGATRIAGWKVIEGHDAWAPMAYAGGKLVLRDATTLICMQLAEGNAI